MFRFVMTDRFLFSKNQQCEHADPKWQHLFLEYYIFIAFPANPCMCVFFFIIWSPVIIEARSAETRCCSKLMRFITQVTISDGAFYRWFSPDVTKDEAERLLHLYPEGGFIMRESQSTSGDFVLSVRSLLDLHLHHNTL